MISEKTKESQSIMNEAQWYLASWNYFSLLSGQRMQMLQFYISLEVFLCGAFVTLISLETRLVWAEAISSFLILLISIVFSGLDYRTKTMLHECENAMIAIERVDKCSSCVKPITSVNSCKKAKLTYSKWIVFMQGIFATIGFGGVILVLVGII